MGTDNDIDCTRFQCLGDLSLLFGRAKARQGLDPDRPVGEAVPEILCMLFRQQGGRYQHGNLASAHYCQKGGAHCHLGFAKPHIAANQPVHRTRRSHIGHYRIDGILLVRGLLERKCGGKSGILGIVKGVAEALARLAFGIDFKQLGRYVTDLLTGAALGLFPLPAAEFV